MSSKLEINPKDNQSIDNYKLLIGSILPRPIGFISTINNNGIYNLAPFSFFNGICSNPPSVLFCPVIRGSDGQEKDTLKNIKSNKEFVVNIVSEEIAEQMNQTSAEYPPEIDEFLESGLTPMPSKIIKPPFVKESKVNMECKLIEIIKVGKGDQGSGSIVIGEIVYFHINKEVYKDGKIILNELKPIGRLGGSDYCKVTDIFSLPRPQIKIKEKK